jgi:hypothetical protein
MEVGEMLMPLPTPLWKLAASIHRVTAFVSALEHKWRLREESWRSCSVITRYSPTYSCNWDHCHEMSKTIEKWRMQPTVGLRWLAACQPWAKHGFKGQVPQILPLGGLVCMKPAQSSKPRWASWRSTECDQCSHIIERGIWYINGEQIQNICKRLSTIPPRSCSTNGFARKWFKYAALEYEM